MVMFDYRDVSVGDVLLCVRNCDCCWREGVEYEVKSDEDGELYMVGSCEAQMTVADDWKDYNARPMHEIFELNKKGVPW